jgi:para-aminobenzoate synthetase component 1
VREINLSGDELVASLLEISKTGTACLLDSCGVSYLESHLVIAGIKPVETLQITNEDAEKTLSILDEKLSGNFAAIFSISYDFGLKLQKIKPREKEFPTFAEPDVFLALFDCLIIHDYDNGKTFLDGNENKFDEIEKFLFDSLNSRDSPNSQDSIVRSNFTRAGYLETIEKIQEFIRAGDTYQTNLTQQLRAELPENLAPQQIFWNLRRDHPAPFAAFLKRNEDFVISASPERFFKVKRRNASVNERASTNSGNTLSHDRVSAFTISTSPIKGTRPRGKTPDEDGELKKELLESAKDRAENTMIVDLLRNDIGRICKFGSVAVEKLCDLETHPTFFHLVSTVSGQLREETSFSDIIRAVFPCGSITGAPKIRTMQIIDELETVDRGLSMGAIGYYVPSLKSQVSSQDLPGELRLGTWDLGLGTLDLSVAIRTMTVRGGEAIFNVGGGIVIDSIPEKEYEETLTKAKALLASINGKII